MRRLFLAMVAALATTVSALAERYVYDITFKIDPTAEGFKSNSSVKNILSGKIWVVFNGTEVVFNLGTGAYVSGDVPDFSDGLKEFYFYYISDRGICKNYGVTTGSVIFSNKGKVEMPVPVSFDCDGLRIDMSELAKSGALDAMFNPPLSELSGGISPKPKSEPEPVVYAEGGKIDCSGTTDKIYDANGVDVTSQNGSLPSGVYIVDCDGVKKKVVMK